MNLQKYFEGMLKNGDWKLVWSSFLDNNLSQEIFIEWVKGNLIFRGDSIQESFLSHPRTDLKWKGWSACQRTWFSVAESLFYVDEEELEELFEKEDSRGLMKLGKRTLDKGRIERKHQEFVDIMGGIDNLWEVVKYNLLAQWVEKVGLYYFDQTDTFATIKNGLGYGRESPLSARNLAAMVDEEFTDREDYSALLLPDGSVIECEYGQHNDIYAYADDLEIRLSNWSRSIGDPTYAIGQQLIKCSPELNLHADLEGIEDTNKKLWWLGDNLNGIRVALLDLYASGKVVGFNGERDDIEFFRHLNQLIGEKATSLLFLGFVLTPYRYPIGKTYLEIPPWSLKSVRGYDFIRSNAADDKFGDSFLDVDGIKDEFLSKRTHLNQKSVSGIFVNITGRRIGKGFDDWDISVSPAVLDKNPAMGFYEKTDFNQQYDSILKDIIKEDYSFVKQGQIIQIEMCFEDCRYDQFSRNNILQFKWLKSKETKRVPYNFKKLPKFSPAGEVFREGFIVCSWAEVLKIKSGDADVFDIKALDGTKAVLLEDDAIHLHIVGYAANKGIPVIFNYGKFPYIEDNVKLVVSAWETQVGIAFNIDEI